MKGTQDGKSEKWHSLLLARHIPLNTFLFSLDCYVTHEK